MSIFYIFAKNKNMDRFFEKLESAVNNNSFVKMTLSKPVSKNNDLRNIYIKPILLKNNKMYQFTYRYDRRDETKNFTSTQTMEQVRSLVPEVFQNVSLFTLTEDVTLLVSKKGKPTLMCKKISESRDVDLSHDHEKQRLIDPSKPWWHLLGLTTRDGKVTADMQHKFKQICKYVEIVDGVMRQTKFDNEIHIADMGAGKGYLTFALYEYLTTHYDKKIVMEGVEIRKDLVERNVFARWFDDEGVATYNKQIVKNGVLQTYLYNLTTAAKDGVQSTGNGYRAGGKMGTSAAFLVLKPGKKSKEELFQELGDGVYITDVSGLHAGLNEQSGSFSLQSSGFLIKNGKIDRGLDIITISGNLLEVFNDVLAVGSDIETSYNGVSAPSLLIKKINVSGK